MNRENADDPHCPECGEPIGMTSAYCIHCRADLTEDRTPADAETDSYNTNSSSLSHTPNSSEPTATGGGSLLDPDGVLTTLLTAVIGLIGGFIIGLLGWFAWSSILPINWSVVGGLLVWFGTAVYLARRQYVQAAVSKAAYGVAIAIMFVPLIVFDPVWDTGGRMGDFVMMGVLCAIPAVIVGVVGLIAARFVPEEMTTDSN